MINDSYFGRIGGNFPYTNLHNLNEDWILWTLKKYTGKVDELVKDYTELKEYLLNYVDEELKNDVAAKLDEMAEDGTLAAIINERIFGEINERIAIQERAPYQYEPEREAKYRERVRETIASWLEADYLSTSFIDNQKGKPVDTNVFAGYRYSNNGFVKAPIGEFVYSDERDIKDPYSETVYTIRVMDMDCSTFTSLITKGYSFQNSIYKDSVLDMPYNNDKAIEQATFIYHADRNDYIGYDANNNVTTHEQAEALYYSGSEMLPISYIEYGGVPEYDLEAISKLETGDIIFMGTGANKRAANFMGIHHAAIFVRTLEEINQYLSDNRELRVSETGTERYTDHPEMGYLVHVMNPGAPRTGLNVLRVDSLWWAINNCPQYAGTGESDPNRWQRVYGFKVQPNTLNISGGFEGATSIRNAWGKFRITNWDDKKSVFSVRTGNGGAEAGSLGSTGFPLSYVTPVDFNSLLENGDYAFRSNNAAGGYLNQNLNRPCNLFGVLHVRNNKTADMFKTTDLSYPALTMTTQTYDAYSGATNYYYKIQRHIGAGSSNIYYWTQWYLLETNDPRGTDLSQYPAGFIPECEPEIKPITRKYF